MSGAARWNQFAEAKYLSLETWRNSGVGVRTPVWFASAPTTAPNPVFYVYSEANAGKVKRIRRQGAVRIARCDAQGKVTGTWVDANAVIVGDEEARWAMAMLNAKYRPWKQILDLLARLRPGHHRVVIAITAR
jgi:PPOX class probable F420-dependent enzyme